MLLDLAGELGPGDTLRATLGFQRAGARDVVATVLSYAELEAALEVTTWERDEH